MLKPWNPLVKPNPSSPFLLCLCVVLVFSSTASHPDFNEKSTVQTSSWAQISDPLPNTTVLVNHQVDLWCGANGTITKNITYRWYREDNLTSEISWLANRTEIKPNGTLLINPTKADDAGKYTCVVTNEIGAAQIAFVYLSVEYPARVIQSPSRQYLKLGQSGIVKCHISASPPVQFVIWSKDRRPFYPSSGSNFEFLTNGSLHFSRITYQNQGLYRCTPYNIHGTGQSSKPMHVIVRP